MESKNIYILSTITAGLILVTTATFISPEGEKKVGPHIHQETRSENLSTPQATQVSAGETTSVYNSFQS